MIKQSEAWRKEEGRASNKKNILPSPKRKVRKTSHQNQINNQNKKRKAVHTQTHVRGTTLVAEERVMPKEVCQTTVHVITITQVKGEVQGAGLLHDP